MKHWIWLTTLFALVALLPGCSSGGGNGDESRIRGKLTQLARAMERERVDEVMYLYSPDYLNDGVNYVNMRNAYAEMFDQYNDIHVEYSNLNIRLFGHEAVVTGRRYATAVDTFDNNRPVYADEGVTYILNYEYGDWYFYGNQRSATTTKAQRAPLHFAPKAK